jgi:hypothetical protein
MVDALMLDEAYARRSGTEETYWMLGEANDRAERLPLGYLS